MKTVALSKQLVKRKQLNKQSKCLFNNSRFFQRETFIYLKSALENLNYGSRNDKPSKKCERQFG